jgi:ubiquinone/menaquinone biosynthesis C-methylase UbiE
MTYGLRLSEDELSRYRMMADHAREHEGDLWQLAGLVPGARVADVGCSAGAMVLTLAELVGPSGHVVGLDSDQAALERAQAVLARANVTNAELKVGKAEDTGLPTASFDTVVVRHVLAHNGAIEQLIVDHLADVVRPGGCVYLLDVDATTVSISPVLPDLEDLQARYIEWHASKGNDLRVGRRLAHLGRSAGLAVEAFRGWFEITEWPRGMRGPAWAAREAIVHSGLATQEDLARWAASFDEVDSWTDRPQAMMGVFAAVCRRSG